MAWYDCSNKENQFLGPKWKLNLIAEKNCFVEKWAKTVGGEINLVRGFVVGFKCGG